jgi:hypothetical protein
VIERRRVPLLAAACAALTAFVFLPALRFPFLNWDDGLLVAGNVHFRGFAIPQILWDFTSAPGGAYQPLGYLSYALDYALWGLAPLGFHMTNVLLHAFDAALFFLLARLLLRPASARAANTELAAAFAALLWALHPLRVESVAWVSERRDVLCGAFTLAAALAWTRGADCGEGERGRRWRQAALGLGAAAMASKVFAIVLPGVLLILDVRLRGRPRWMEKIPWAFASAATLALNVVAQMRDRAAAPLASFGIEARLAQAAYGLSFYVWKTLWPAGLGPLYERSLLLEPAPFVFAALAAAAAAAGIWRARRRFPWLAQAALAYFLFALPALGLFKSGRMTAADRYSYLPCLPLALLAGASFARLAGKGWARIGAATLILMLAIETRRQLPIWSSDASLWTRACAVSPLSYFAHLKLAEADEVAGRAAAAADDRAEAERLHAEVFSRAASIYEARGDRAAAAAALARVHGGLASFASPR